MTQQQLPTLVLAALLLLGCGSGDSDQQPLDLGQVADADSPDSGPVPDVRVSDMGTDDSGMAVDTGPSPPEPESFVLENVQNDFIYRLSHLSVTDRGIFGIGPAGGPVVVELNPESPAFVESWVEVARFLTTGAVVGDIAVVTTAPGLSGSHQGDGVWAWVIDLNQMKVLGTTPLPECVSPPGSIVMNESLAVIPCFRRRIYVLDLSDPTDPHTVLRHEASSWQKLISVDGDAGEFSFRYVGEDEIRRVSRNSFGLESDSQTSQFEQGWIYAFMAIGDGRLWSHTTGFMPQFESVSLTGQDEISTLRTTLDDFPELSELEVLENGIGFFDSKLFLAGNFPDGKRIIVFDVQDPTNPILVGSQFGLDDLAQVKGFAFHDNQAYIYGYVIRGGGREPILSVPVADLLD